MPLKAGAGLPLVVTDTTTNQGAATVPPSTTGFFLSKNILLDSSAIELSGSRAVPALGAGMSSSGSTTVVIPASVATGSYYLIAKADVDNVVPETQKGNNTAARAVAVGGDLVESALTVPATIGAGSTIVVTDTTANQGGGAVGASTTRFYLSSTFILDASAVLLAGARSVPSLDPGATSTGSTSVTIPTTVTGGTYYLIAKADADNVVVETIETNNTTARSTQIGPDLIVSALTVPATGGSNATIVVTDTTMNQGAGAATPSVTRFYLSTHIVLDASAQLLPGSRSVPALAAGASSSGSTPLTLPPNLAVASYYLIAKADADNTVAESQENNNTAARTIAIGPDLILSSLSVPFTITAGSPVLVTDTVLNQGGDMAGSSTTRFYLSTDVFFDAQH